MKLKMKALAAAVALTVAGSANAAIDTFGSGDGELFFSVRDNTNNTSFVLDLNVKLSDFIANPTQSLSFGDMLSYVASSSGNLSWSVMAGDSTGANVANGLRYLTTAAAGSDLLLGAVSNNTLQGWNIMDGDYLANVNGVLAGNSATSALGDNAYFTTTMDSWQNNSPVSATAGLGDSQNFYLLANSASTILPAGKTAKVNLNDFSNTPGNVWTLATDATGVTSLTYGAVPVPPAVWLLGSALLGLVGVARRKSQNV